MTKETKYGVIITWVENVRYMGDSPNSNPTEEWDIIHKGPLSWEEAEKVKMDVMKGYGKLPSDLKKLRIINNEKPIIIEYNKLQLKLKYDNN